MSEQTIGLIFIALLLISATFMFVMFSGVLQKEDSSTKEVFTSLKDYSQLLSASQGQDCSFVGQIGDWSIYYFTPGVELSLVTGVGEFSGRETRTAITPPAECTTTPCLCMCQGRDCDDDHLCEPVNTPLIHQSAESFRLDSSYYQAKGPTRFVLQKQGQSVEIVVDDSLQTASCEIYR